MKKKTPISHLSKAAREALIGARVCHLCQAPAVEEMRRLWWCRACLIADGGDNPPELQTRTRSPAADCEES